MSIITTNLSLSSALSQTITEMRERLTVTSQEAVTGRYSDLTEHLSGSIGTAMLSQQAVDSIQEDRERLTLRESRLDIVQNSLATIQESADTLSISMLSATSTEDSLAQETTAREARAALEQAFSVMNVRHGDRFLFSGDATSTVPMGSVDDLLADIGTLANDATTTEEFETALESYFNDPDGGWQTNIFNGLATSSDPDGVTAADPAITQLISGLAVMALGDPAEGVAAVADNTEFLDMAANRSATGATELVGLRASLGLTQSQISRAQDTLDTEETVLTNALNTLTARDQYEAASELEQLEASLEASYLLTSRLANLTLLNYL